MFNYKYKQRFIKINNIDNYNKLDDGKIFDVLDRK